MKTFTQFFFLVLCLCGSKAFSQVKIGDNPTNVNPNSLLELESHSKGLLLPRLTNDQIAAMTNVPAGMLLFSITDSALYLRKDTGWAILEFKTMSDASPWTSNGNNIYTANNTSNVGIGTPNPVAKLQVADSSVLFSASGDATGTSGNLPLEGAGRRLLWYSDEGAFRAGRVSGTAWDKDSIGQYSIALGNDTKAKGFSSFAAGGGASATGDFSAALGGGNANGIASTASGTAIASGALSTAMGSATTASGYYSTSMGVNSNASGFYSTAMGSGTVASGEGSTAIGAGTTADGFKSTAMGFLTIASGAYSTSAGFGTTAPSFSEIAIGSYNTAYTGYDGAGWQPQDRVFSIGNGKSSTETSNVMTVLKGGKVGIGTDQPSATLDVAGDMKVSGDVEIGGNVKFTGGLNMGLKDSVTNATLYAGEFKAFYAGCPTGYKLIGGGGGHRDFNYYQKEMVINYSGPDPLDTNRWRVLMTNLTKTDYLQVQVYAICAKVK